ncbi:hypothetical protein B0A50_03905 [Salinomyces thailandicus]|uniref:Uncharacterized protein n=1 Tax=Salinomyces thailandicus TaxID=706561 RepID=A0A4U0U0V4_9PEZI|nr:hypothetical protein B0A50_03905 [Salinomyces thailandica]
MEQHHNSGHDARHRNAPRSDEQAARTSRGIPLRDLVEDMASPATPATDQRLPPVTTTASAGSSQHPFAFIMYGAPSDPATRARKREVRSEAAKRSAERRRATMEQRRLEQRSRAASSSKRRKSRPGEDEPQPATTGGSAPSRVSDGVQWAAGERGSDWTPGSSSRAAPAGRNGGTSEVGDTSLHRQQPSDDPGKEMRVEAAGRFRRYEEVKAGLDEATTSTRPP